MQASTKNRAATRLASDSANVVAQLRRPETYPEAPGHIEVIETHFAWVFLSERFAYKLKKPIRFHQLDFSTFAKRRRGCRLEVELNRRLAQDTYLAAVPLCRANGGYALEGTTEPIEWLVKMRRLPRSRTLEREAVAGSEQAAALDALMDKLAAFYADAARASWSGATYVAHLAAQQREWSKEIVAASGGTPAGLTRLVAEQSAALERHRSELAARVRARRVLDAHGDLRPEHIFLLADPQIIDCLEFSRELRLLDTAEEIAFLDLECERLGRPDLGESLVARYRARCVDTVDAALLGFYRSRRALARALVSAWHLHDGMAPDEARHWLESRDWYLAAALASLAAHSPGPGSEAR